jgi:hypothetical protein
MGGGKEGRRAEYMGFAGWFDRRMTANESLLHIDRKILFVGVAEERTSL